MLESGCSSHSLGKASELETPCGASTIDGRPGNKHQKRGDVQSQRYLPIFLERSAPVLPEQREVHIELLNFTADTSYLRYTSTGLLSPPLCAGEILLPCQKQPLHRGSQLEGAGARFTIQIPRMQV